MFTESYASPGESTTSSSEEYSVLVESLHLLNSSNMDENISSPLSNYGYVSSSMSPMSTTSESSTYNMQNLNINYSRMYDIDFHMKHT